MDMVKSSILYILKRKITCGPARSPCPPATPLPVIQTCAPPPPPPPCVRRPVLRNLGLSFIKRHMAVALTLSAIFGAIFFQRTEHRVWLYEDFHKKEELIDWLVDMILAGRISAQPAETMPPQRFDMEE